jgi:hypothetical protein
MTSPLNKTAILLIIKKHLQIFLSESVKINQLMEITAIFLKYPPIQTPLV